MTSEQLSSLRNYSSEVTALNSQCTKSVLNVVQY